MTASASPVWLQAVGGGVTVSLHVQPGAGRCEVVGPHGDALKIRIDAPPVDGQANEAVLSFVARRLGVPRQAVSLVTGRNSRRKRVRVAGIAAAAAAAALGQGAAAQAA